jgi:putative tryptophan/tyrosine transport system substrate-binding protein
VTIEEFDAEGHYDRLPALSAGVVRRRAAAILASASPAALAAKAATKDIPIVFSVGIDPVKVGLVASINRPDGNVTGVYLPFVAAEAKRLQIPHQLLPQARTVGALLNPGKADVDEVRDRIRTAAPAMGLELR